MPERGARMPTRNGLLCAMAGPNTWPDVDKAPTAATDASSLRREIAMVSPSGPASGSFVIVDRPSMIYQTHVTNKQEHAALDFPCGLESRRGSGREAGAQEAVDLRRCQRPIIVEVGDDGLHEGLRERDRALLVAQVVIENRERQLLRAVPFVRPFESVFGDTLDLVVLAERVAVNRHHQAVDGAASLVRLHDLRPILLRA